jgi:cyclopropane fatty-acyl-phospholipid synthase-like methyltransferase
VSDVSDPNVEDGESGHWFEDIARHLGEAYLRYSFTKGTVQEIDFLCEAIGLAPGTRVLDVGCGPGRHALELARRDVEVHGVDISAEFIGIARAAVDRENLGERATFERLDARELDATGHRGDFDAAICLCQGAFGLMTRSGDDERVVAGVRSRLRVGGRLALSAFNAYFAVKYHESADFDAASGVSHEVTEVRDPDGRARSVDLWTGCYTPRELRFLMDATGFRVDRILSVEPGEYEMRAPSVETPEFLVLATAV